MKKKIAVGLIGVLLTSSVYANDESDSYAFHSESLVGIEGGYSIFDVEKNEPGNPAVITDYNRGEAGLKIGASTKNYRVFLGLRNYFIPNYDYFATAGAELQYLFNFSKVANFFIGANGGMLNARFTPDGEATSRELFDPYFGGDLGFNIHIGKMADLELGARTVISNAENTKNNVTYKFDHLITGYASIIFRYQMDD